MNVLYFILFIVLAHFTAGFAKSWIKEIAKSETTKEPVPIAYKNGQVVYKD